MLQVLLGPESNESDQRLNVRESLAILTLLAAGYRGGLPSTMAPDEAKPGALTSTKSAGAAEAGLGFGSVGASLDSAAFSLALMQVP